ncbi:MAG TPA: alpha/beta fold hydrolase [Dongiaceae bacterium]|nr:alpha/beta fold hydrolase [Dongiaceae bacterium]
MRLLIAGRTLLQIILIPATLLLAACEPRLQEIGPDIDQPHLTATAIHTADGIDLPLREWLPRDDSLKVTEIKAVILAIHGFNDYSKGMTNPAEGMVRRGMAVYAYDQRGFGRTPQRGIWPGNERMIADLKLAVDLLHRKYPDKPLFILGESMGASVVIAAAAEKPPLQANGLILVSPALWGWETQSSFNRHVLDWAAHFIPWMTVYPTGVRVQASDNTTALRAMGRDRLVIKDTRIDSAYGLVGLMSQAYEALPVLGRVDHQVPPCLLLYGGREQVLADHSVLASLADLPQLPQDRLRIGLYPNGYHYLLRDLDAQTVFTDIASWMADPGKPLPSGADQVPTSALKFQR